MKFLIKLGWESSWILCKNTATEIPRENLFVEFSAVQIQANKITKFRNESLKIQLRNFRRKISMLNFINFELWKIMGQMILQLNKNKSISIDSLHTGGNVNAQLVVNNHRLWFMLKIPNWKNMKCISEVFSKWWLLVEGISQTNRFSSNVQSVSELKASIWKPVSSYNASGKLILQN